MADIDTLDELASQINFAHDAAREAARLSVQHALTAGRLLLEAKTRVPHGRWIPWVEANCRFALRTAQAYMRLAELWPAYPEQMRNDVAYLPLRQLVAGFDDGHGHGKARRVARSQTPSGEGCYRCPCGCGFEWFGDPRPPVQSGALAAMMAEAALLPAERIAELQVVIGRMREASWN